MTSTPTQSEYTESVRTYAEQAVDAYGTPDKSREELRTSTELGEAIRDAFEDSPWLYQRPELTVHHSDQNPSDPTHAASVKHAIEDHSELTWNTLIYEGAYTCLYSDVTAEAIDIIVSQ